MTAVAVMPEVGTNAVYQSTNSGESGGLGFSKNTVIALTSMTAATTSLLGCLVVGQSDFGTATPVIQRAEASERALWAGDIWTPVLAAVAPNEEFDAVAGEVRSDQDEVLWVKERSGLTWDQLGKVFGVSRRAVHLWANGGRMNETNAEVLRRFSAEVAAREGSSPEQTRAALLAHDVVDTFRRAQVRVPGASIGAPFAAEEKVENVREAEAAEA